MKRLLRHFTIVNAVVAAGVGIGGWAAGWTASTFAIVLGLVCFGAFFVGFSAFGGAGPSAVYTGAPGSGPGFDAGDVIAASAETGAAYGGKRDHFATWQARHGWNTGSHHLGMLMLATGLSTGIATLVVWGLSR